jgi:hypothetical protein
LKTDLEETGQIYAGIINAFHSWVHLDDIILAGFGCVSSSKGKVAYIVVQKDSKGTGRIPSILCHSAG